MKPDITTIVPSKTGMEVTLFNLLSSGIISGDGWDWDILCYLYTKDDEDPSIPPLVAVSIAVKGFKLQIESKFARGNTLDVCGKFGKFEKSTSGNERFRRIFCEAKDVTLLKRWGS